MNVNIKDSRVLTYLGQNNNPPYQNTVEENELVQLWNNKFLIAKNEYESTEVNSKNVKLWRNAYRGKFNILDEHGNPTTVKQKALRKMAFELVEQKVDPHIPAPKMSPRNHSDLVPVDATESLIRYEMNKMLSEETHDLSEHATLIDSTSWFKVSWNPFDNTHERSGMPMVELCTIDTVFPQPGIIDYKKLEYIFHTIKMTLAQIADIYDRTVVSEDEDIVEVVECYYLNRNRHVGKFAWVAKDLTVLCNDLEWGMRRRRECKVCTTIVPIADECPTCGSKNLHYVGVKTQTLQEPLEFVTNPYRSGMSTDIAEDNNQLASQNTLPAGTEIPFYLIRQLPFVPKRTIKVIDSMYGISEVELALEPQDAVNKFFNKAERKSDKSKTYITKLKDTRIDDEDNDVVYIEVESAQEGQAMQVKQIVSDLNGELIMAQSLYDNSKSTTGVTDTDQGKYDATARSGKAKQTQLIASEKREKAPMTQRNAAYAGVYELIFKYMLAFSDEERAYIKLLPDGTSREELWSKYMFLAKDKDGNFYYRDDFAWGVDDATNITQDRAAMWQLITNDFNNGVMGTEIDPVRALHMYWNMMAQQSYPTAKFALAFLKDAIQHLPTQIEQALVNNPEAVEMALSYIADMQGGKGAGGARDGAGRAGSGQTKDSQQQQANNQSRSAQGQQTTAEATSLGGMQGGTKVDTKQT